MIHARVTDVLRPFTNYDQVPSDILQRAASRGTSVHAICAGIAKGNWIPDGMIGEDLLGYVNSFRKWRVECVSEFVIVEKRYYIDEDGYTGQIDFVVRNLNNELYLVDLKTSASPQKTYPLQMAAYDVLLKKHDITVKGAMIVYLKKDGEYPKVHTLEDMSEEQDVFKCALKCWHYFNKGKKDGRASKDSTEHISASFRSDE